jgi:hypothetical protein
MITQTRINQELSTSEELDWMTALTAPQIKKLAQKQVIQLGLFDQQNLAVFLYLDLVADGGKTEIPYPA